MDEVARQHLFEQAHQIENPGRRDVKAAFGRFAVHDAEFHAWIAEQGDNEWVAETLSHLHAHMHPFRLRFHALVAEEAVQEHNKILKALIAGYPEAAAEAMKAHILRSRERMAPTFETLP